MTAVTVPRAQPVARTPVRTEPASVVTQILALSGRSLRGVVFEPRTLIVTLLGPILLVSVLSQLLGSLSTAISFPAGTRYVDFVVPAIMITTALQSALGLIISLLQDMRNGLINRLRTMAIWPGSVLVAHSVAGLVRMVLQLTVLSVFAAVVLGFDPPGGILGTAAAVVVSTAVSTGLGWIFIALACQLRHTELVQAISGTVTFPLIVASNAFVPEAGLPTWLRHVAAFNPVSHSITAARELVLGHAPVGQLLAALAGAAVITIAGATVATRGLSRPG
ncbi:ABC transporter permease [Kribbella albertanoniae]|uniref:Transport permease protein n=1 Tax=Kribbella albertanoniae TaxID=1266829 RepID=A0A4R4QBC6_9ACTN|nr:ABC transporter permease [Kribbella albertanoniae]TDC32688.1 ABC transporter permease [Kribbella albertanoniae]